MKWTKKWTKEHTKGQTDVQRRHLSLPAKGVKKKLKKFLFNFCEKNLFERDKQTRTTSSKPLKRLKDDAGTILKKDGPFPASFSLFSSFLQTVNKCSIKVADDWIRTRVLWYRKQPLCQLRHNHFPRRNNF